LNDFHPPFISLKTKKKKVILDSEELSLKRRNFKAGLAQNIIFEEFSSIFLGAEYKNIVREYRPRKPELRISIQCSKHIFRVYHSASNTLT
jgi:hypothetical protein